MHGHSGDSSGVGAYVESGSSDGRRKRRTTDVLDMEMRWHDEMKAEWCEDQLGWEREIERTAGRYGFRSGLHNIIEPIKIT